MGTTRLRVGLSIGLLAAVNPMMAQAGGRTPPERASPQVTSPATRPAPPTRDPNTPGFVTATELPDGSVPPLDADGNFVIGPTHTPAFEMVVHEGVPRGAVHTFTMSSADSKIFPGIARDSGTFGTVSPTDPATLVVTTSHPAPYTRAVAVYVPAQYVPGTTAPFIVGADGPDQSLFTALDNLIAEKRVPAMIAISIGNGGGDAQGSERGLEYDTMSGRYAEFVETEVLPLVERQYNVKLTKDPEGRATMGGSSGGSAAFIMAWYHPELYHRVLAYSITAVNQQWPHRDQTPHGAWEFHERLIPNSPVKPIRVWMEVGDRDFFNPNVMRDDMHDWVVASENMARVLAAKGYHYQFVFARNAAHVDRSVKQQTLPEALDWVWRGYANEGSKSAPPTDSGFRVTLLGTGSPNPRPDRFGPSILVEAGPERLVFDCGRSCTTRLWQLRIPLGTVKLFITHLHSDHTVGIPDLWLTGFLSNPYGRRTGAFRVWGPAGTAAMMTKLREAYDADIRIRQPQQGVEISATDFVEGPVYDENGVRVTAFKVSHDDIDAYGFRIDYHGHSVVLSGDTRPSANLVAHSRGADVVVHEVGMSTSDAGSRIVALLHSTPEQAGEEFSRIRPKLAVFSHFSLFGTPEPTMDELLARTRTTYQGRLEIGEDLMAISVGDSVVVTRWPNDDRIRQRQTQSLFNGRDLSGWHVDVPAADSNVRVRSPFLVRKGMLVSLGEPRGHLLTDSTYRDYRLEIEYRFAGTPGNAGVLVHASTPRALYGMFPRSIEVQMEHANAGDFWCILEDIRVPDMERRRGPPSEWGTTEGKARRILNLTDDSEKPVGEWNTMVIEAVGRSISVWVNGDLVNEGSDATADRGRIALQSEGSEVEFRKVLLAPISRLTITR